MALYHGEKIKLFALTASENLAKEVSDLLGVPLSGCQISRFADGEVGVNIDETVRGHKVFVVQSTSSPVNEHLMELLIFIDALKRASAREINIVMPYYGYSRQDRKAKSREPISAKLVADLLTAAGATRIICMDLHAPQIQGFFNIPIDNLQGMPLFHKYIRDKKIENFVVVSPDHGGAARARRLAEPFEADIAIIDKRRPRPNVSEVMGIIGNVEGKNCVIIDDLIDTAGTVYNACQALKNAGAKKVYMFASHAILSGPAVERLSTAGFEKVVLTNSIEVPDSKKFPQLEIISIGGLISKAIERVLDDLPLSPLFDSDKK